MMKKKRYIAPAFKVFSMPSAPLLTGSELTMPWSGNNSGSAGPGEIDDYTTIDTF